jgi:ABC-type transport system involved in multi-copper enzyme maturation permease subunit
MRYLAILKDSFREALDTWVLVVMVILSTLSILAVGTLSFKPLPAKEAMDQFFPNPKLQGISMMFVALNHAELNRSQVDPEEIKAKREGEDILGRMMLISEYRLDKVDLVAGEADSPESTYALTVSELFPRVGKIDDPDKAIEKGTSRVRTIFQKAEDLGFLKIKEVSGKFEEMKDDAHVARVRYKVVLEGNSRTLRIWAHEPSLFFGALPLEAASAPLGYQLYVLGQNVISIGAWAAILVGVIITSFFIPNMLAKGTVEMMLVKPINRWSLILYKYVGGLSFIFLINAYAVTGMWLMLGLRTGLWANGLLLLIVTLTFFFAILYSVSTFVSVATRSIIATIIVTILVWIAFAGVGITDNFMSAMNKKEARIAKREGREEPPKSDMAKAAALLHSLTPRTEDLNQLNDQITFSAFMTGGVEFSEKMRFSERAWWESILVAFIWIAIFLALSCTWFWLKDY